MFPIALLSDARSRIVITYEEHAVQLILVWDRPSTEDSKEDGKSQRLGAALASVAIVSSKRRTNDENQSPTIKCDPAKTCLNLYL